MTPRAMPPRSAACIAALALALGAPAAQGQELRGSATLYGWLPWIDGTVAAPRGDLSASLSGGDVLDALDFAFMATAEAEYGRFGVIGDLVYGRFSSDARLRGPATAKLAVDTSSLIGTAAGTFRVIETDRAILQAMAGIRVTRLENDLRIVSGGPEGIARSASSGNTLVDPLIGVRGQYAVTDAVSLIGLADIGGFGAGSDLSWEVFGGAEYAFNARFSTKFGFRYISIDFSDNDEEVDLDFYGPAIGLTVLF